MHRQDRDWWMPGGREKGDGERLLNGYRVSFWGDENILELSRDAGCTTLQRYSVQGNCSLESR